VSDAHPGKWVFCIDIFTCDTDLLRTEQLPKLRAMRKIVADAANRRGQRVVHVDGTKMLTSPNGLTADLVHPSPFGMAEMARNLAAHIQEKMDAAP